MSVKSNQISSVPCPAKALFIKHGPVEYVYINLGRFKKEGKKGVQYKRKMVGETKDRITMIPNENYFKLFHKTRPVTRQSDVLSVGAALIAEAAARSSGLLESLEEFFHPEDVRKLLDLAAFILFSPITSCQYFSDFAYTTALLSGSALCEGSISQFLKEALNSGDLHAFLQKWARINAKNQTKNTACLVLDLSRIPSFNQDGKLNETGPAKENPDQRDNPDQTETGLKLVIRKEDGLPVFYQRSSHSQKEFPLLEELVKQLQSLGCEKSLVVLDKDHLSTKSIQALHDQKIDFLFELKDNQRTEKLIEKYGRKIANKAGCYLPEFNVHGMSVRHRLFDRSGPLSSFHIIWSASIQARAVQKLLRDKLPAMSQKAQQAVTSKEIWQKETLETYRKYFDLDTDQDNRILSIKQNDRLVTKKIKQLGFQVFVSSDPMSAKSTIELYAAGRQAKEVFGQLYSACLFDGLNDLKGFEESKENSQGFFFICFLAFILRSLILHAVKNLRKDQTKAYTLAEILAELARVQAFKEAQGSVYRRHYDLSPLQKEILASFQIEEDTVDEFIDRILTQKNLLEKKQAG